MERFNKDGRWMIPLAERKKTEYPEEEIRFIIKEAYCPEGCNIIDNEVLIIPVLCEIPSLSVVGRSPAITDWGLPCCCIKYYIQTW